MAINGHNLWSIAIGWQSWLISSIQWKIEKTSIDETRILLCCHLGCPAQFKVWGWSFPSESSYSFKACRRSPTACEGGGQGIQKQRGYRGAIFIILSYTLSTYVCIYINISSYLAIYLSSYLSIYLSISTYLSIYLYKALFGEEVTLGAAFLDVHGNMSQKQKTNEFLHERTKLLTFWSSFLSISPALSS